jgi:hypothetical protein
MTFPTKLSLLKHADMLDSAMGFAKKMAPMAGSAARLGGKALSFVPHPMAQVASKGLSAIGNASSIGAGMAAAAGPVSKVLDKARQSPALGMRHDTNKGSGQGMAQQQLK